MATECDAVNFADTKGEVGDLGNLEVGEDGSVNFRGQLRLETELGNQSFDQIIGKVVVLHRGRDDFSTQPPPEKIPAVIGCGVMKAFKQ